MKLTAQSAMLTGQTEYDVVTGNKSKREQPLLKEWNDKNNREKSLILCQ